MVNTLIITNVNKEIPLIYCFNICILVQWAASVKLLIMFVLLKILLVLNIILSFWMEFTS